MSIMKTRDQFIDYARGFAIFLVVLGHAIQYGSGAEYLSSHQFQKEYLFIVIYSFHMPLFAFLSGYLFYLSKEKPFKKQITRKIETILIPILSWSSIVILLKLFNTIHIQQQESITLKILFFDNILPSIIYSFWFLWAIFIASIITLLAEQYCTSKPSKVLFWTTAILLLPLVPNTLNSDLYSFILPFFAFGYYSNPTFRKDGLFTILNNKKTLSLALLLSLITYFVIDNINKLNIIANNDLIRLLFFYQNWALGFLGTLFSLLALQKAYKIKIFSPFLEYLGKISLGIYVTNFFESLFLTRLTKNLSEPNLIYWLLFTFVEIGISILIINIINRHPLTKKIFLGGR